MSITPPTFNQGTGPVPPSVPPVDYGPAPTPIAELAATLGPIVQQQINGAMEGLRAEVATALNAMADNFTGWVEQRLDTERQGFAGTLSQLGNNQQTLAQQINSGNVTSPEQIHVWVLEGVRDFFLEASRNWAMNLLPEEPVVNGEWIEDPNPAPAEKGIISDAP